ncbi:MAG: hypothetical protein KatS3mg024_0697 [Armatimonadota bacterium]|nr:MAG: hypothetical protein KatS3mg024_0697 [Armatimonadota bacterium]
MKRICGRIELTALLTLAAAGICFPAETILQLRIENSPGGRVQARAGTEGAWATVGRVIRPATQAVTTFPAARYTPPGSVAATAVHGIRIRLPASGGNLQGISIQPREFGHMPRRYGGHVPGPSAILTDIPAGTAIFRDLAPLAGDPVRLEQSGSVREIPPDWRPTPGDILRIDSRELPDRPVEIVLWNKAGGSVEALLRDGSRKRIATVLRPVRGTGRFDGTAYTGVGALNTNHGGVVTISTAPALRPEDEGQPPECRGGFQIVPAAHARTQPVMPQSMVVAPLDGDSLLEGRPPLFGGALTLGDGSPVVEMLVPGRGWISLPAIVGKQDDAFTKDGLARVGLTVQGDVEAFRIRLPVRDKNVIAHAIRRAERTFEASGGKHGAVVWELRGTLPPGTAYAVFSSEGRTLAISNVRPFRLALDRAHEGQALTAAFIRADGSSAGSRTATVVRSGNGLAIREGSWP